MREVHRVYLERPSGRRFWRYRLTDSFNRTLRRIGTDIDADLGKRERERLCFDKLIELKTESGESAAAGAAPNGHEQRERERLCLGQALADHMRRSQERRGTTLADDRRAIEHLAGSLAAGLETPMADIDADAVAAFIARMKSPKNNSGGLGFKESTRAGKIRSLCHFWNLAISRGWLEGKNPFSRADNRDLPRIKPALQSGLRFFSRAEAVAMIDVAPSDWWKALMSLYANTGWRRCEALYSLWENIDLDGQAASLRPQAAAEWTNPADGRTYSLPGWTSKTDTGISYRTNPIPASTVAALHALPRETPYVFLSLEAVARMSRQVGANRWPPNQCPIHTKLLGEPFAEIQMAAANGGTWRMGTLKGFRRGYLTHMASIVHPNELQRLAGHEKIETTMTFYVGADPNSASRILQHLS